jgi:shikimate kinase
MRTLRPIIVVGFMACGKTEVARALARRLDLPLADLDKTIAQQQGRTSAQLIVEEGEAAFRSIETATLREVLEGEIAIVALGGGAWITEANRNLISEHGGLTVWLDTPFELCWQRIEASPEDRPLGRSRDEAEQLYRLRQPVYQLADIHVSVMTHEPIEDLVNRLERELKGTSVRPQKGTRDTRTKGS